MARIRTIKPEYWSDEKLSRESDSTRFLFIALWSMADDFGRLIDNEKQIEAFVFPHEERSRDVREGLARLARLGRIKRGTAENGQHVIEVVNWTKHQKVDRPSERGAIAQIVTAQEVTKPSRKTRESSAKGSRLEVDLGSGSGSGSGPSVPDASAPESNGKRVTWLTPYLDLWHRKAGTLTAGHAAKVLAPVREEYGDADALLGMGAYLDEPRLPDKPVTVDWFAKNAARWIREGKTPLQNPDGTLTVRGERITRPGT